MPVVDILRIGVADTLSIIVYFRLCIDYPDRYVICLVVLIYDKYAFDLDTLAKVKNKHAFRIGSFTNDVPSLAIVISFEIGALPSNLTDCC